MAQPDIPPKPKVISSIKWDRSLASEVIRESGTDLNQCFRCGTCASGCPFIRAMDYAPFRVLMLLQYGLRQEALSSRTIWMCVGCHTCSNECPMNIDMAAVMDTLRHMALKEGVVVAQPEPPVPVVYRNGCGPLEVLVRDIQRLKDAAKRNLNGLKFVPNYGCTSFRPPHYREGQFIEGEMERILSALGAEPLTRTYTNRCCGSFLAASRPDISTPMVNTIIEGAQAVGADCIITACATCQLNLENRCTLEKKLPVFHFSEILALALGQEYEGWFSRHLVGSEAQPLLQKLGLAD